MIRVSSEAEAAAWARVHHCVPMRRTAADGGLLWDCDTPEGPRRLVFRLEPAAPRPADLTDADLLALAGRIIGGVPLDPRGWSRDATRELIRDLYLAERCVELAGGDTRLLGDIRARRSAYSASFPTIGDTEGPPPLPDHGFAFPPELTEALRRTLPFPLDNLGGGWEPVWATAGSVLLRHPIGRLCEAAVDPYRRITALQPLIGDAAMAAFAAFGFALSGAALRALDAVTLPCPLDDLLSAGLPDGRAAALVNLELEDGDLHFIEVESHLGWYRGALLVVHVVDDQAVGWRLVEGAVGYRLLRLYQQVAPTLPGVDDGPSEVEAQRTAAEWMQTIADAVGPLLRSFLDPRVAPEALASVTPRPGDAEKVFIGEDTARIAARYADLWATDPPRVRAERQAAELAISVAPAGLIGEDATTASTFPDGYGSVTPWLRADRVWVAWTYRRNPEDRGVDYDGLVWIDDHWAWFPAPHRIIPDVLSR
jgi:hypothetical protein